jgi:formylglycine-generating enzyme required for sulfatase activity
MQWRDAVHPYEQRFEQFHDNWQIDNQPVVNVSCYEAMAFCRWISVEGWAAGWLSPQHEIRLPTEAEWELAFGDRFGEEGTGSRQLSLQPIMGNTSEANIKSPCPVGLFLEDDSSDSALDLIGNVWEWCFPEMSTIRLMNKVALRGGSYASSEIEDLTQSSRKEAPHEYGVDYGFRLCQAPVLE